MMYIYYCITIVTVEKEYQLYLSMQYTPYIIAK